MGIINIEVLLDVMKGSRAAFVRLAATAVAIALIMLAVLFSTTHLASFPLMFSGEVIADFFRYLPRTIELIAISFVVASIAGLLSALPPARAVKPLITSIAVGLQCIPFFLLAIVVGLAFAFSGMHPIAGMTRPGFADSLSGLLAPVGVLAMFQFPLILEHFDKRLTLGPNLRAAASSILGGLAQQFARNLPDLLTATIITEIVLGRPGEGRLFWHSLSTPAGSEAAGLLLFMALSVLVTRFLAETLTRHTTAATDSHA
ncbi:MAG TPA: hypothetical protein VN934_06480 [Candidatus Tumulicola sp.]|nr:hypothetical protein [Candidatus Tumulicola sp.]